MPIRNCNTVYLIINGQKYCRYLSIYYEQLKIHNASNNLP